LPVVDQPKHQQEQRWQLRSNETSSVSLLNTVITPGDLPVFADKLSASCPLFPQKEEKADKADKEDLLRSIEIFAEAKRTLAI